MKKGLAFFVPLALVFLFCSPVFSQQNEKSIEVVLIDNFDTPDQNEWSWQVQASRYIDDGSGGGAKYPLIGYFKGIQNAWRVISYKFYQNKDFCNDDIIELNKLIGNVKEYLNILIRGE